VAPTQRTNNSFFQRLMDSAEQAALSELEGQGQTESPMGVAIIYMAMTLLAFGNN